MRHIISLRHLAIMKTHNWRASLKKFCRLKVLLIQLFPVALSVIFLLVYAKCNFASVRKSFFVKVFSPKVFADALQLIVCQNFVLASYVLRF